MGRLVLLSGLAALLCAALAGCAEPPAPDAPIEASSANGHADLACAACHRGDVADRELASVPGSACATSGCHGDGGPAEVVLATVRFAHRSHGGDESVAMECAGCHFHDVGTEPLSGGTDACGLCHAERLGGESAGDCRTCHRVPAHEGVTSQGVHVPHEGMPWIEGECVRCHYDVAEPGTDVSAARCADCHREVEALTARSIGRDLHPEHVEVSCTACHAEGGHRIVAMSSAVALECSHCHLAAHDVAVDASFPGSATCAACHRETHALEQRLVLGVVPGLPDATPSEKFVDGLTCRSCHVPDARRAGEGGPATLAGSAVSCTGCHRGEYATVLRWWNEGTAQRVRLAERYVDAVTATLEGADAPPEARAALDDARELLALVRDGGGQHNLPLAHRLLGESVAKAGDAARGAGRSPPTAPGLGNRPRMGLCTYCHYRLDDPWQFGEMSDAFHRDVMDGR